MNVEREIQKENALRQIANSEIERLKSILEPFKGGKVKKADGGLVKKLRDLLQFNKERKIEPLTPTGFASLQCIYVRTTTYSLMLHISICYNGGSYDDNTAYCEYINNDYHLGDIEIKEGILVKLYTHENMPMLDAKKQRRQYNKVERLCKELEAERDKLFYGIRYQN